MNKNKTIPFPRGSKEWEKIRSKNKWDRHRFDYKWRLNHLFSLAKSRAKNSQETFSLEKQDLYDLWEVQDGCCAISGAEFNLGEHENYRRHPDGPSIDKINPKGIYEPENIRLVTTQVNISLNNFDDDSFIKMCRRVVELIGFN